MPFGGDPKDSASDSNFPEAEFPKSDLGKKEGEGSEPSEPEPEPDASESEEKNLRERHATIRQRIRRPSKNLQKPNPATIPI